MSAAAEIRTVSSPMELLHEAESAQEVLVLTYTANLEFFERWGLGASRALRARTTVIADATMVTTDPLSVRGAGVRYLDARAACPDLKAFHPKLLVIADTDRCTIAIGSGNLTLAGWHGNDELWTVVRARGGEGPKTVAEAARFLRQLCDGRIQLSHGAAEAVTRVVGLLDGIEATEPGPELVSSLYGPILDQLPTGPVDELNIYSPFFDPALEALSQLHDQFTPMSTNVFVQSDTSVDGKQLVAWLTKQNGQLLWCADDSYRHGKLIEWSIGGTRTALTGSPNLSAGALLRGLSIDGRLAANCELGTIWTVAETLTPAPVSAPASGANALSFSAGPGELTASGPIVLDAVLTDPGEVTITLSKPLAHMARLQTFVPDRDWTTLPDVAQLDPGEASYRVPALVGAGVAVRLFSSEGRGVSNEVYVLDPARVRQRPWTRIGPRVLSPEKMVVAGDLDSLFEIADLMREGLIEMGILERHTSPSSPGASVDETSSEEAPFAATASPTLADYRAACAAVLNEETVDWVLTLPRLPGLAANTAPAEEGLFLSSDATDEAADAGTPTDEQPTATIASVLRTASPTQQRRARRFCEQALDLAETWPNFMRAYAAKLTLHGIAADLWEPEDEDEMLTSVVDVLTAPGDETTEDERRALAGYATLTDALLRNAVDKLSVRDEQTLRYEAAAAASGSLLAHVDPEQLELLAIEFADMLGGASGQSLLDLATEIASPPGEAEHMLDLLRDEYDIDANEADGIVTVHTPLAKVYERDLMRIAAVCSSDIVAVRGVCADGATVGCIWQNPVLLILRTTQFGTRGRLYQGASAEPAFIADGWDTGGNVQDNMPRPSADWMAGQRMPEEAAKLLEARPILLGE